MQSSWWQTVKQLVLTECLWAPWALATTAGLGLLIGWNRTLRFQICALLVALLLCKMGYGKNFWLMLLGPSVPVLLLLAIGVPQLVYWHDDTHGADKERFSREGLTSAEEITCDQAAEKAPLTITA
jgi:hypothetical protein